MELTDPMLELVEVKLEVLMLEELKEAVLMLEKKEFPVILMLPTVMSPKEVNPLMTRLLDTFKLPPTLTFLGTANPPLMIRDPVFVVIESVVSEIIVGELMLKIPELKVNCETETRGFVPFPMTS